MTPLDHIGSDRSASAGFKNNIYKLLSILGVSSLYLAPPIDLSACWTSLSSFNMLPAYKRGIGDSIRRVAILVDS